nr:hypothetical protein B0A51_08660 [Rachicladosporium sp. CCFEE 5018]
MFEDMALAADKENVAPAPGSDPAQRSSSPRKGGKKPRSKSIGPGGLEDEDSSVKQKVMMNRRKSAFVPAVKGILPSQADADRKAARRKSMANRRVSFAPEATLHTWDVIEYMRDHTTSTESSETTRRASSITRSAEASSSPKSPGTHNGSGEEPPSTPPEQASSPEKLPPSPAPQRDLHQKKVRRGSGVPPMDFNNPEDLSSPSVLEGSSDVSDSEGEGDGEDDDDLEDATGTAMSLDMGGDNTLLSTTESEGSSTSSSARLERNLRAAAEQAGTRGIEYDEAYEEEGEQSMEMAGDEITNAFEQWEQQEVIQPHRSAALDQENVNPFSPAFKAVVTAPLVSHPETIIEEEEEEMSMDVTRAVGGITRSKTPVEVSSPADDGTMEFTRAVGKVHTTTTHVTTSSKKRRLSTTDAGSPGVTTITSQSKRRRSSIARSSLGDETMDLTIAMGGIEDTGPPARAERRRSVARRRSSGVASEQGEMTMDFTRPMGGLQASKRQSTDSFDENEELTMELTTVLGGIKAAQRHADATPSTPLDEEPPRELTAAVNTTPKDQERFRDVEDTGPVKLLTPILKKQAKGDRLSAKARRASFSAEEPPKEPKPEEKLQMRGFSPFKLGRMSQYKSSPLKQEVSYPDLPAQSQQMLAGESTPVPAVVRQAVSSPGSGLRNQANAQLEAEAQLSEELPRLRSSPLKARSSPRRSSTPAQSPSPRKGSTPKTASPAKVTPQKVTTPKPATPSPVANRHSSPAVRTPLRSATPRTTTPQRASTPEQTAARASPLESRKMLDSIKLMSTPRKETLKSMTPKKQTPAKQASPVKRHTPATRSAPRARQVIPASPAKQLSDDLVKLSSDDQPKQPVHLQEFLDAAGIRFMDLTTTKRRMTAMPTPSKNRKSTDVLQPEVTLAAAVIAAACTEPEKELFSHACHELKRYIHEGKGAIKELEAETFRETPPLLQAYMSAGSSRGAVIDAQLRDIKTHARLRSKEMWYGWRGQLLEELMHVLHGIAEGLLRDDEVLLEKEEIIAEVLPGLLEQRDGLEVEAARLQEAANAVSPEEKEELDAARERLVEIDDELEAKRLLLQSLEEESQALAITEETLIDARTEYTAAIASADKVRDSCRSISLDEITISQSHIETLETTHHWSITSASPHPTTLTMTYASTLQLFFHPTAFNTHSSSAQNAPVGLTYLGTADPLPTTLRFFLQLIRAALQALPQSETTVPQLLKLVSSGWEAAQKIAESERRLGIEGLTATRILADDKLQVSSFILLPKVKTKVRVDFEVAASVAEAGGEISVGTELGCKVVYGEPYNESKMKDAIESKAGEMGEGWADAVRDLREKLLVRGKKAGRK